MIAKKIYGSDLDEIKVNILSDLCFRCDKFPTDIDLLFVFGSSRYNEISNNIMKLFSNCKINTVYLSGGINPKRKKNKNIISEAETIKNMINLPLNTKLLIDKEAINTLENVKNYFNCSENKKIKNIVFISKSYSSGRCYYTLKKFFNSIPLYSFPYEVNNISSSNWIDNDESKALVVGEYERIKSYGEKGDIYFDKELKLIIEKIDK